MGDPHGDGGEERALLEGDPSFTADLRAAIRIVVRAFRFTREIREDLVQDVLERVYLNVSAGRFRGDATLKTYAQSIARYACLGRRRRSRLEASLDASQSDTPSPQGPEEDLIRRERIERGLLALRCLPEECRELLRLIFVERLSYEQVAERLGVSEGTVKSRVHRCRLAHLRDGDLRRAASGGGSGGEALRRRRGAAR